MKFKILATLITAFASFQSQAVTYTFSGFFGEPLPPGRSDYTASFSVSLPDFVSSNQFVPVAEMQTCIAPASPCVGATFHVDAKGDGLTLDPGVQAVEFKSAAGYSGYYYFSAPAFSTPGSYSSLYGFNPATLVVTVPEASSFAYLSIGLAFAGGNVAWRRRRRVVQA